MFYFFIYYEMVYARGRFRKNYRLRRRLTKASIYANKSARAQSRQIARLNSKVNYLTRQNRPEILTLWRTFSRTFTNASLASNYETGWYVHPWTNNFTGRSFNDDLQGNYCRIKGFSWDGIVEYSDDWSNSNASQNHQRSASYRVVILQDKDVSAQYSDSDLFSLIFNVGSGLVSDDTNTTQPLKTGIKSMFKVLFSRAYTISNERPVHHHKISIPLKKLMSFSSVMNANGTTSSTSQGYKGNIRVVILTGGLHSDADFNSQIVVSSTLKIAFTDN